MSAAHQIGLSATLWLIGYALSAWGAPMVGVGLAVIGVGVAMTDFEA